MNKNIINSLTLHPFLFALFPFLFLFSHNMGQITAEDTKSIFIVIIITVVLAFLLWLPLSFILKDKKKAALIISLGLILFFSYGYVTQLIEKYWKNIQIGSLVIGLNPVFLTIWGIIFLLALYFIIRWHSNLRITTGLLNIISASLVVITLVNIGIYEIKVNSPSWNRIITENNKPDNSDTGSSNAFPDIYYIILDGYNCSNILQSVFGYDNSEFIEYLTERDFFIASESHSNYQYTAFSLASSLNMEYLDILDSVTDKDAKNNLVHQMITENRVIHFLNSKGYCYIHISSGWGPTQNNKYADQNIVLHGKYNEYLYVLIQTTMAGPFMKYTIKEDRAKTVLNAFDQLAKVPKIPGPKFVFAHIVCPHPPYVFGANGEPVPEAKIEMTGNSLEDKELYLNQLIFITKKVETLIDEIFSNSETPPVVILQGDHGTATTFPRDRQNLYIQSPTPEMIKERFSIFNVYHLPDNGEKNLYDAITPVNSFRLIFNYYLGTNYELLADRSYYSTSESPFEFTDVTDIAKQE